MPPWLVALAIATSDTAPAVRPADHWFAPDKVKHATFTFAVQAGSYATLRMAAGHRQSAIGATVATIALSLWKEHRDRATTGFSVRDLAWDAAGIALASVIVARTPSR